MPSRYARLVEIQEEMLGLLAEAEELIRQSGNKFAYDRAKAYWLAQVEMALTDNHSHLGGAGVSMDNTINELDDEEDDDEEYDDAEDLEDRMNGITE